MFNSGGFAAIVALFAITTIVLAIPAATQYKFVSHDEHGLHWDRDTPPQFKFSHGVGNSFGNIRGHNAQGNQRVHNGHHRHSNGRHHAPGCHPRDNITQILLDHHDQLFCSSFLHLLPTTTTATATQTTSEVLATITSMETSTTNLGTITGTDTSTETDSTTITDATVTDTETTTTTTTSTTTTTTTTELHTAGVDLRKRSNPIPDYLPFPPSKISSACSQIITPTINVVSVTTTATATLTTTTTTTATSSIPQQFATTSTTTTEIITSLDTSTTDATTTTSTTTTSTYTATATQCAASTGVVAGGIPSGGDGTLNFDPTITSPDECCDDCWNETGCGLWFFFEGFGCFTGTGETGPNPSSQCPSGLGTYAVVIGNSSGDVGGAGPCAGGFTS